MLYILFSMSCFTDVETPIKPCNYAEEPQTYLLLSQDLSHPLTVVKNKPRIENKMPMLYI